MKAATIVDFVFRCQKEKQKVVKMFAFVIFTFGICWLPYHVYFIYSYHNPQVTQRKEEVFFNDNY